MSDHQQGFVLIWEEEQMRPWFRAKHAREKTWLCSPNRSLGIGILGKRKTAYICHDQCTTIYSMYINIEFYSENW
jgi:hypothetical protein